MTTITLLTAADCLARIGDPTLERHMTLWDVPAELEIGAVPKRIYCNKNMVAPLAQAFGALVKTGEVRQLRTWDGCFNIRRSKGNRRAYSLHAWGLAVDLNAAWNGFGAKPTLRPPFVQCFTDAGFDWGGEWRRPDGMHFQLKRELLV